LKSKQLLTKLLLKIIPSKDEFSSFLNSIGIKENLTIIDIGAHKGQTSLYFNKQFPNSKVIAFEPSPTLFKELSANLIGKKNIKAYNFALGNENQSAFLTSGNSDLCGQISETATDKSIKIEIRTLNSIYDSLKIGCIDLMKIDVEGFEINVLEGASNLLSNNLVKLVYLECDFNKDDKQHSYFNEVFEYLISKNFSFQGLFEIVRYSPEYGIGYCNALFLNNKAF
jgi:FkbM family methyltransferase